MKRMAIGLLAVWLMSCTNESRDTTTDSTGTVENIQDTNRLVTDSVEVPDTNTAEIDPMKKIN